MIKKVHLSKTLEILYFVFLISISILAVINLYSRGARNKPMQILSVVSGSMRPGIPVGSAVFVNKVSDYYVNDIIAYRYQNRIITHRVIYAGKYFLTKGDANNVIDNFQIDKSQILGKVFLHIPWVGYIQESSKSLAGLIGFIYIPALLIIVVESRYIVKEFKKFEARKLNMRSLVVIIFGLFIAIDNTYAFYSTKQLAFNGQISVTTPQPSSTPTPSPSITPTPTPSTTPAPSTTPQPSTSGNTGNGSGSTNVIIINNSNSTTVNQSNTSNQTTTVTNTVNTGNNAGGNINTASSSATTTITNSANQSTATIQ